MEQDSLHQDCMHGSVFVLLKRFVENMSGYSGWNNLTEAAGTENISYQMHEMYPVQDLTALVKTLANANGLSENDILEQFGEFLVPDLLLVYKKYINPTWRTYEMLLHTEEAMHGAVKKEDSRTNPPLLLVTKKGNNQLIVDYYSKRKMGGMAVGIIRGIAKYYNESDLVLVNRLTPTDAERVQIRVDFSG